MHKSAYIYLSSLHVSGNNVPIIRRKLLYLCDTGICHSVWVASGLLVGLITPTSRPDDTRTEWQTPVSQRYNNFSWWWAHGCPKHAEKRNKYTKQKFAPSWIYLQDCTRMKGQQNTKFDNFGKFTVVFHKGLQLVNDDSNGILHS